MNTEIRVLGGVIDGLNKSEAIDNSIEHARQAIQSQLTTAKERIVRYAKYAKHMRSCEFRRTYCPGVKCSCGLQKLRDEIALKDN